MKKLVLAVVTGIFLTAPAQSVTLVGGVQKDDTEGRIGIRVSTGGDIIRVHPGSPAEQAGLRPHDTVISVDGRHNAVRQIAGEPGTVVQLDVRRGMRRFQIAVRRSDVREISYR
jgi:C-terminal processing protease CtpA/Prc